MKHAVSIGARLVLTAGFLLLAWQMAPPVQHWPARNALEPGWFLVAMAAFLGFLSIMAFRLWLLARNKDGLTVRVLMRVTWAGAAAGQTGLGIAGSDTMRVVMLARSGRPMMKAAQLVLADRLAGLTGLLILGLVGLGGLYSGPAGALGVCVGALAIVWLASASAGIVQARLPQASKSRALRLFGDAAAAFARRETTQAVFLSILVHACTVGVFAGVAAGSGIALPWPETAVAVPAGQFGAALPISAGGWGVREVAIAQAYAVTGAAAPGAVAASILFGVAMTLFALPGLLAFMARKQG